MLLVLQGQLQCLRVIGTDETVSVGVGTQQSVLVVDIVVHVETPGTDHGRRLGWQTTDTPSFPGGTVRLETIAGIT